VPWLDLEIDARDAANTLQDVNAREEIHLSETSVPSHTQL